MDEKVKGTNDERLFAPIRDADHNNWKWLIMDYAEPMNVGESVIKSKIQSMKLKRAVENSYDVTIDNIGKHESYGTVVYDYPWAHELE